MGNLRAFFLFCLAAPLKNKNGTGRSSIYKQVIPPGFRVVRIVTDQSCGGGDSRAIARELELNRETVGKYKPFGGARETSFRHHPLRITCWYARGTVWDAFWDG